MNSKLETTSPHYATVKQLLINFIASAKTDKKSLLKGLKAVEKAVKAETKTAGQSIRNKSLWMRFFSNDTLVTTINDLDRGLNINIFSPQYVAYTEECIDEAVKENSGMQLHLS